MPTRQSLKMGSYASSTGSVWVTSTPFILYSHVCWLYAHSSIFAAVPYPLPDAFILCNFQDMRGKHSCAQPDRHMEQAAAFLLCHSTLLYALFM